jgi:hypothetical protein
MSENLLPYHVAGMGTGADKAVNELQQLRDEVELLTAELLRMRAIQQLAAKLECSLALAERIMNIENRIKSIQ